MIGLLDPSRQVGYESRKSYTEKIANGFFEKYLSGATILEIGYKGGVDGTVPIVAQAIGVDLDYPGYDGIRLPFSDHSQDAVYSSHCLEHILDYRSALREWYRVLKIGGYLVIAVPHHFLYERRRQLPSHWNRDHKRFYTPGNLLREIEDALEPNTYRVRHLADNDFGFDYSIPPREGAVGCQEIELVLEKLKKPFWDLEDGTSRIYHASEFSARLEKRALLPLESDFSLTNACVIWGPYVQLAAGDYEAKFFFEAIGIEDQALTSTVELDIAQNTRRIASLSLDGSDGNRILREGSANLRFLNEIPKALFEFRVYTFGRPFIGKLRFFGVSLDRIWTRHKGLKYSLRDPNLSLIDSKMHTPPDSALASESLHLSGLLNAKCYSDPIWSSLHDELETYSIDKHVFKRTEGQIYRKGWEWTHCLYGLSHLGMINPGAHGLGVGVGHEPTIFYLGERVASVTATDLYGGERWSRVGGREADSGVVLHPETFCPRPIERSKINFQNADGMALPFEDDRFDFCWSLSSIEHFGGHSGAAAAMREMGRVVRPGGIVCVATEYLMLDEYDDPELFTRAQIGKFIIHASPALSLVDDIDWDCLWPEFLIDSVPIPQNRHRRRRHVVINNGDKQWTSIILFFKKISTGSEALAEVKT